MTMSPGSWPADLSMTTGRGAPATKDSNNGVEDRRSAVSAMVVVLMIAVIAVRLHEVVPAMAKLRPGLLLMVGGPAYLLARSKSGALFALLSSPIVRMVLGYLLLAVIGIPFAVWRGGAAAAVIKLIPGIVLFVAIMLAPAGPGALDRILGGFIASTAAFAAALLLVGRATAGGRLEIGVTLDANDAAGMFAAAAPFAAMLALSSSRAILTRLLGAAALLLLALGTIKSGSRGGVIAIGVGLFLVVIGQRGVRRVIPVALFAIGMAVGWLVAPQSLKDRFSAVRDENDYNFTSYTGRVQIWRRAIRYIGENPVVGLGIGNFPVKELETVKEAQRAADAWGVVRGGLPDMNTHNAYLQAAAELGLPGILVFLLIVMTTMRRGFSYWRFHPARPRTHRPDLFAAICAFAASAMFLSHAYSYVLFALAAIVDLADRVLRVDRTRSARPSAAARRPATFHGPSATGPRVPAGQGSPAMAHASQARLTET